MNDEPVEILLVEDNPNDIELTLHALRKAKLDYRVHTMRDGAEAVDFLFCTGAYAGRQFSDGPKVVLLDIKLPKIGGLEVLRRIKSDPRTQPIPVVVLTSSREPHDITTSYGMGANSYIVKPVDHDKFNDAMRDLGAYWMTLNQPPQLA